MTKAAAAISREYAKALGILLLFGVIWSSVLFWAIYPHPSPLMTDDLFYLLVAKHIVHDGMPYRNLVYDSLQATNLHGNFLDFMKQIGQPDPVYKHVLGIHPPYYSYFLSVFLFLFQDDFLAVYMAHSLLLLAILVLTFQLAFHCTNCLETAFLSSFAVLITPTISTYLPLTMKEIYLVFLSLLCISLALRKPGCKNDLYTALALSLLVLSRFSFLILACSIFFVRLREVLKEPVKEKQGYLGIALLIVLPLLAHFSIGRMGILWFYQDTNPISRIFAFSNIFSLEGIAFFLSNLQLNITKSRDSLAWDFRTLNELYLYGALISTVVVCWKLRHHRIVQMVVPAQLATALCLLIFYNWFGWRHIRALLWALPFAYIFIFAVVRNVQSSRVRKAIFFALIVPLLAGGFWADLYLVKTQKSKSLEREQQYLLGEKIDHFINAHYPGIDFIAVSHPGQSAALYNPERVYYPIGDLRHMADSFKKNNIYPQVILLRFFDNHQWLKSGLNPYYQQENLQIPEWNVYVRRPTGL